VGIGVSVALGRAVPERVGVALPDNAAARSLNAVAVALIERRSLSIEPPAELRSGLLASAFELAAGDAIGREATGIG
jgi:hypothetical protein